MSNWFFVSLVFEANLSFPLPGSCTCNSFKISLFPLTGNSETSSQGGLLLLRLTEYFTRFLPFSPPKYIN